jgi:hypothetical protein
MPHGSATSESGSLAILIAIPLRRGDWWARWAILAVGLPVLGATVYLAGRLAFLTGARTPWLASGVLLALFLAGVGLVEAKRTRDTSFEGAR